MTGAAEGTSLSFDTAGIRVSVYTPAQSDIRQGGAPCIYLVCDRGEGPGAAACLASMTELPYALVTVSVPDWSRDLSPWEAPPVFKKGDPFGGGAAAYLAKLTDVIVPDTEGRLGRSPSSRILAGYSLAGLFAVWAACRTDLFAGFGSASGSMWFPGFEEYIRNTPFAGTPKAVYFSLGDREAHTKNPLMKTVEEKTGRICRIVQERGIPSVFELNPGNHFVDGDLRTAKACAWLLARLQEGSVTA